MANFRLIKVSDTMHRIQLGRDTIGWCRKFEMQWVATDKRATGTGETAVAAFHNFVRECNNISAQKAGFANARAMVDARNEQVRKDAERMNALMRDALGDLAPMMQVRLKRGRRILV